MMRLDDIFGQDAALAQITGAYLAERLPHGMVFAGPSGVGKRLTATALAGLFLCEKPNRLQPCGTCDSCRIFPSGNHPDYHFIYRQLIRLEKSDVKARDLSIDVIRPYLLEPASRKPAMGRGKVFVVEEAELMNASAQNSLLKTLEEPAGRALIILLTDSPGALLPTIRSRCQMVRFAPMPSELVARELAKRGFGESDVREATLLADGSLGQAIAFIEQQVVAAARELRASLESLLAGKGAGDLPAFLRDAAKNYAAKQLEQDKLASEDQLTREGLSLYLKLAAEHFRRRLPLSGDSGLLGSLCSAIESFVESEGYLDANVNIPLILQQLAVRLERYAVS
jgi:DNA polymerase III subunit delta'